ncbi:CTP-dependent riboflavin kinase [Halomarina pelagica]|uniref:CTP-dependent riboflavin kinase n=1 Tax=Halomarina pelagica TaxID=2961599 RepID=UPI0020C358BC|nr:CTP-dependent riboflavin kinase [Halomarina sp. BND7]
MAEPSLAVGADARETLKVLALQGALVDRAHVTCSGLAERLDVSTQTASRRLQELEDADLVEREILADGQFVRATDEGERVLEREYADYRRLFETDRSVSLTGTVTSGMGEGRHYISLPGYMRQFEEKLGYEPFRGTLNVELDRDSTRARAGMDALDPVRIDGWEDEDRTYGPAFCWPATVEADGTTYGRAHVIAPERTHHGQDKVELVAPDRLRDQLGLADGDRLTVRVEEDG